MLSFSLRHWALDLTAPGTCFDASRLDEFFEAVQVTLNPTRYEPKLIADFLDYALRVILHLLLLFPRQHIQM